MSHRDTLIDDDSPDTFPGAAGPCEAVGGSADGETLLRSLMIQAGISDGLLQRAIDRGWAVRALALHYLKSARHEGTVLLQDWLAREAVAQKGRP